MTTTVYALVDPRDGRIRYVGRTSQPLQARVRQHVCARPCPNHGPKFRWLAELRDAQLKPVAVVLQHVEGDEDVLSDAEEWWIRSLRSRGASLTNGVGERGRAGQFGRN